MRKRKCMDLETGQAVSSLECYGADVEYDVCVLQECPSEYSLDHKNGITVQGHFLIPSFVSTIGTCTWIFLGT